jgi:predicted DNA-binding ArsR family transcriptional regulator
MFFSEKKYSIASMQKFEHQLLKNLKADSVDKKNNGELASHWYTEALVETIIGEHMGSALVCMKEAANLGHLRAQSVIKLIESESQPPQAILLQNFMQTAQVLLNTSSQNNNPNFEDETNNVLDMLSSENPKERQRLLTNLLEKGSFDAYIYLQGPTLKNRSKGFSILKTGG